MNDSQQPPVEIQPRTPNTAIALLHHRHNSGAACGACEIVALRERVTELENEVKSLRGFKQSVDEALNRGDGTYRP